MTNTYAYFRYNEAQVVFVFVNNSEEDIVVPWGDYAEFTCEALSDRGPEAPALVKGRDVITGSEVDFAAPVTLAPHSSIVVEF